MEGFHYDDVYPDPHPHPASGVGVCQGLGLGDNTSDMGEYFIEEKNPFSRIIHDDSEEFSPVKGGINRGGIRWGHNYRGGDSSVDSTGKEGTRGSATKGVTMGVTKGVICVGKGVAGVGKGVISRGESGLDDFDALFGAFSHDRPPLDTENISPNRGDVRRGGEKGDGVGGSGRRSRGSGMGSDFGVDGKGRFAANGGGSKGVLLLQRRVNRWTQPGQGLVQGLGHRSTNFAQDGSNCAPSKSSKVLGEHTNKTQELMPQPTLLSSQTIPAESHSLSNGPVKLPVHTEKDFIPYPTYLPALLPTSPPSKTTKNKYQSIRL